MPKRAPKSASKHRYLKSLGLSSLVLGTHADVARTKAELAMVLEIEGRRRDAISMYHEALSMYEAVHGAAHPTGAKMRMAIGEAHRLEGKRV